MLVGHARWASARLLPVFFIFSFALIFALPAQAEVDFSPQNQMCIACHQNQNRALYMEWERSSHAASGIGCLDCHAAEADDIDAFEHGGTHVSVLVTPKDCSGCHQQEFDEFTTSHHAKAGEILASLDNILAEKVAGLPHNKADAVNGCWQCHGSIIKYQRDSEGAVKKDAMGRPMLDPDSWPNSGMGRLNPDGSKGSCHACHSRHAFEAKLARNPENCGKCHMGPDHPQIEIYEESKHGIAFHASKEHMALDSDSWILGKDYSAAPTCATCHISGYMTPEGEVRGATHDVGDRISWTLRPVISTKLNQVVYEDGFKEDYPHTRELPAVGDVIATSEKFVENEEMATRTVERTVARIVPWEDRRGAMKAMCHNCHNTTFVNNFYHQFDSLVELYNEKFARPAKQFMDDLEADGVLNPNAPFEHEVQWVFWELWHHEGRRARHGASMMGPDYTHWHGMYEVSKHYYTEFLPAVIEAAEGKSHELGEKYRGIIAEMMTREEHAWQKGLSPEEADRLRKAYEARYDEK